MFLLSAGNNFTDAFGDRILFLRQVFAAKECYYETKNRFNDYGAYAGQTYTPVKNGANIDLQLNGVTAFSMTKDSSVSADTIKNAPAMPTP